MKTVARGRSHRTGRARSGAFVSRARLRGSRVGNIRVGGKKPLKRGKMSFCCFGKDQSKRKPQQQLFLNMRPMLNVGRGRPGFQVTLVEPDEAKHVRPPVSIQVHSCLCSPSTITLKHSLSRARATRTK